MVLDVKEAEVLAVDVGQGLQFQDVNAALTALALRDEGLRFPELLGGGVLRKTSFLSRRPKESGERGIGRAVPRRQSISRTLFA